MRLTTLGLDHTLGPLRRKSPPSPPPSLSLLVTSFSLIHTSSYPSSDLLPFLHSSARLLWYCNGRTPANPLANPSRLFRPLQRPFILHRSTRRTGSRGSWSWKGRDGRARRAGKADCGAGESFRRGVLEMGGYAGVHVPALARVSPLSFIGYPLVFFLPTSVYLLSSPLPFSQGPGHPDRRPRSRSSSV